MPKTRTHRLRSFMRDPQKWNAETFLWEKDGEPYLYKTSLCGNTTYANTELLKLVEDWDEVDCPSCLHIVWLNSPCSKSKKKKWTPDTDMRAVLVKVPSPQRPCRPQPHEEHLAYERDEDDWWCLGA